MTAIETADELHVAEALQLRDPYTYVEHPASAFYSVFLTTSPLRELFQGRDRREMESLADTINAAADNAEQGYRAIIEEYRRMTPEVMQLILLGPQMIATLETIAKYERAGDMGDMGDEELIDGWAKMTQAAVMAIAFVDATVDRARLAANFRKAQAANVMLAALTAASIELAVISNGTDAVVSATVRAQIDAAINDAHGTPIPDPHEESDAFSDDARPIWPEAASIGIDRAALEQAEVENFPLRWMYLSFAAEDDGFRGAAIIRAHGMANAITAAWKLGINPGGSVMTAEIPQDQLPAPEFLNRLLTKAEVLAIWPDSASLKDLALSDGEKDVPIACSACNERAGFADTTTEEFDQEIVGDD